MTVLLHLKNRILIILKMSLRGEGDVGEHVSVEVQRGVLIESRVIESDRDDWARDLGDDERAVGGGVHGEGVVGRVNLQGNFAELLAELIQMSFICKYKSCAWVLVLPYFKIATLKMIKVTQIGYAWIVVVELYWKYYSLQKNG